MRCRNMSSFLLLFLIINSTHLRFKANGRPEPNSIAVTKGFGQRGTEDKAIVRAQIGSTPPRCERKCRSCGHCEAIQVPTNPRNVRTKIDDASSSSASALVNVDYVRGDDSSNYKPMSWKCKCGNTIFNP